MVYQLFVQDETLRKGPWLEEEDERLVMFVTLLGERRWDSLARASGLKRSGKSCRLRWLNYLRPNLKHGHITEEEENVIVQLHAQWGNKWSKIARRLPGRTDNEIKNYWRSHLRKKAQLQEKGGVQISSSDIHCSAENFKTRRDNADQDFVCTGSNTNSRVQKHDSDCSRKVNEENSGAETHAGNDPCGMEDFAVISSPYETRISDWISELSSDQSEVKHQDDYSSTDSCLYDQWWASQSSNTHEFSCSLWTLTQGDS